jgi:hypothetical protein
MAVTAAELLVKITSETTSAESGIRNVSTLLQTLVGATEGAGAGMATMGTKAEAAANQAALLETKASAAAMSAQNLGVRAEQAAVQAEAFASKAAMGGVNAEALGVKAQAAAARAQDLGTRAYAAGGQAEYLGTKAAAAGVQAEALAASAEKSDGALTAFGPAALVAAGGIAVVAAGLLKAGEAAAAFQTQLSQAQANTTMTTQQTQVMGQAILDMSAKSGAGLADLGAGYVHIVNLLGNAADATKVLDVAQQSAISTGGSVADTSQSLARVLKEFGLGADDAAAAMDTLHTAAAAGDLTLEQFTVNSGNALAQAALYHVPLEQVAAAYISLTKHGMDAADANTQMADQFLRLTTVTPKVATELERVSKLTGVDLVGDFTTAGLASKGLTGIYADLSDAEHKMGLSSEAANAENMLLGDSLRGGRGLMIDVAYQTNDYLPILGSLADKTASATKREDDYNRALETTGGQFSILKANAGAAAATIGGPVSGALGQVLETINAVTGGVGTMIGTFAAGFANANKDSGDFFSEFVQGAQTYVNAINGSTDAIKLDTAALYDWGAAASDVVGKATAAAAAMEHGPGYYGPSDAYQAPDVAYIQAQAKEAGQVTVAADAAAKAQLKTNFDQAMVDAKSYYADQAQTAKDAATATKDIATAAAQQTLDATKTEIEGEKKAYDDRAAQDIKDRQAQTTSALQELAKVNTAANVDAAAANTREGVQQAAIQKTADESDTAWKAQVTSIKTAADAGENALHTSNDAILKNATDTANDTYNAQASAIAAAVHSREEADARDIHSHELATAANIASIDREKQAALSAIDEETRAYAAQEQERVRLIDATLAANVKALNDQLADEKRANTERLAVNAMTKGNGAAAGQQLSSYFIATDAQIADIEAALAAKQAGNAKLAAQDQAAADQQAATAKALADELSSVSQSVSDQMVTYKLQTDSTITADNVAALTQQATDQKQTLANELAAEKQNQADKKTATTSYYDGLKTDQQQALADYKWTMAQNLQAFKDTEAQKLAADKTTLDRMLSSIATQQAAENARHADALAKIAAQAAADTAAIDLLAQKRHDAFTAATAQRLADYTDATAKRAAAFLDAQQKITKTSQDDIAAMQKSQTEADGDFALRTAAADKHFKDQQGQIDLTYKQDVNAIQDGLKQHNAALDARKNHMDAYTIATDQSWQTLIGDAQAYAAAIGAAGTPGSFHAPGKGPQGGAGPLYGNDPNVKATFEGYAAQHGLDPATLWEQQSGNLNATAYTGGGGGDVVTLAEAFKDTYAYGSGANTYCERFVANIEGRPVQDTAYVAAQHRIAAGQMHFDMPPPAGAEVYYGPNAGNEGDGHVAIALGNGMQRGVTSSGIKDDSTAYWSQNVAPFLGWVPAHTPMYDQGGIVPGAYGQPSLAIVHGGERYLGLGGQRNDLAAGGSPSVNIYVSGNTMLGRDPQVAQELWRIIEPAMRQQSAYSNR